MPLYDADRMPKLISTLREALGHLKRHQASSKDFFLADPDKSASAKYHFILAIEAAIDICNHLISRNGHRVPEDYADSFVVLGEVGAFDEGEVERFKEMARFRNRLLHIYREVEAEKVYEILQTRLNDFKVFIDRVAQFLEWKNLT